MKNLKKAMALLCAGMMLASTVTGCGSTEESAGEKTSESATKETQEVTEQTQTSSSEAESDIAEVPEEPVEILPIVEEPLTLQVAMPVSAKVEDINTNQLTLYIEETTGIDLEFIELSADTAAQVNSIMNSGDLPDVFIGYDFPYDTLCAYADAGLIRPLDEYIDTWGYNLKNNIMADQDLLGEKILSYTTYDGHVWAVPSGGALVTNLYNTYLPNIQYYYLDELGMELPKTLDELRAFLEAVHEKYPDVIPMTAYAGANFIFGNISQAYQFTDISSYLKLNDGKVEFIGNNEEFRKALEYTKDMVDAGLIDPAAFTQDSSVLATQLAQDGYNVAVLGCGYFYSNIMDTAGEEYLNMGIIGTLEGPDGYVSTQVSALAATIKSTMVITSDCEHPEEAFRLFDFFLSDDFAIKARVGFEGEQWEKAADGVIGRDGEQAWFSLLTTQEWVQPSTNVIWNMQNFIHSNIMNHCEADLAGLRYSDVEEVERQNLKELNSKEAMPQLVMSAEKTTEYNELKAMITGNVDSNIAQFILGNRNLDEFDDYCDELEAMGVERYVELAQEAYDAMME